MNKMLSYFKGFSLVRWIRLMGGLIVLAEAFRTGEFIISVIGFALVFMALTMSGCESSGNTCTKPLN